MLQLIKIEELTVYCISKRKRSIHLPTAWAEVQMNILVAVAIIFSLVAITQSLVGFALLPGEVKAFQ